MKKLKILFVSRAFPPIVGGIENMNYELSQWLPKYAKTKTIANTMGKIALPFFIPWMFFRLLFTMRKYDVLLLGDSLLAILGWWIKQFFPKKKVISIAHGLDITYSNPLYQIFWTDYFFPKCDKFISVGNQTIHELSIRNVSKQKCKFIPNGITPDNFVNFKATRNDLITLIGNKFENNRFILTSGRLVKRKGVAWFIRNVLPNLPNDIVYIIAGGGPDKENIIDSIKETNQFEKVILLGRVTQEELLTLWHTCDVFVQPNIKVEGDMEGFGLSVIEAAVCKIPVVVSHLEGLKDAIKNNKNGFTVTPEKPEEWLHTLENILSINFDKESFGQKASEYVIRNNSWEHIAKEYVNEIQSVIDENNL